MQKAAKEVAEFCRILEHEGVTVKRPEPMRWDELGTFKTPYFDEGGLTFESINDLFLTLIFQPGKNLTPDTLKWIYVKKKFLIDYWKF